MFLGDLGIAFETIVLLVVGGEMLGSGDDLKVSGVVSLESLDKGGSHLAGEERILAVGLRRPAPTGVTGHIDGRGPEGQQVAELVLLELSFPKLIPAGPRLVGDGGRDLIKQIRIPARRKSYSLRENGEVAWADNTMKRLIAVVIFGDPKTFISWGRGSHQVDFLIHGHAAEQIIYPLINRKSLVLIGQLLGIGQCRTDESGDTNRNNSQDSLHNSLIFIL